MQTPRTHYVLIDYENVRVASLALLKSNDFQLWLFLGPNDTKLATPLVLEIQEFRERATYVRLATKGANALDFHIAYYLGALAKTDPAGMFHIISKDTGFDPLIKHLNGKTISVARSVSIEAMPCFTPSENPTGSRAKLTDEELLNSVIADLINRKAARPRRQKTLLNTIRAKCGEMPASRIDKVFQTMVERGLLKIEGTKVSYSLPSES
jgi:hypothetical protein